VSNEIGLAVPTSLIRMATVTTETKLRPAIEPDESAPEIDLQTDVVTIPVKLCNLPPFNGIASQVLALTSDPNVDLRQMSKVIEADPAFAADILFLANSSLFGFPSRMHVLRHAIALLGLDRIKALAVTVAMRGFIGKKTPLVHQCWQHSVACALICEELSAIFDFSGDRAYTAGIMHDIGRLSLLKMYSTEMTLVLTGYYRDMREVLRAERQALNVDHGRAGAWLIKNWALPETFAEICEHHHDAPNAKDSDLLQLVRIGCQIADAIGFPAVKCEYGPSFDDLTASLEPLLNHKAVPAEEDLRSNVAARLAAFEQ
jgi:HD-like signal output (HDOD) protein